MRALFQKRGKGRAALGLSQAGDGGRASFWRGDDRCGIPPIEIGLRMAANRPLCDQVLSHSEDGRLTLAIDETFGALCTTYRRRVRSKASIGQG